MVVLATPSMTGLSPASCKQLFPTHWKNRQKWPVFGFIAERGKKFH